MPTLRSPTMPRALVSAALAVALHATTPAALANTAEAPPAVAQTLAEPPLAGEGLSLIPHPQPTIPY